MPYPYLLTYLALPSWPGGATKSAPTTPQQSGYGDEVDNEEEEDDDDDWYVK